MATDAYSGILLSYITHLFSFISILMNVLTLFTTQTNENQEKKKIYEIRKIRLTTNRKNSAYKFVCEVTMFTFRPKINFCEELIVMCFASIGIHKWKQLYDLGWRSCVLCLFCFLFDFIRNSIKFSKMRLVWYSFQFSSFPPKILSWSLSLLESYGTGHARGVRFVYYIVLIVQVY